jgi:hypothetical protein
MESVHFETLDDLAAVYSALPRDIGNVCIARPGEVAGHDLMVPADHLLDVQSVAADLPAARRVKLVAYAADARWRKEVGGITVAGVPVATDDRSKQMIIGARIAADADADWASQWVGADGVIYPIDATAIVVISNAVQAHVNACFATFASVKTEIDAGTITTTDEIDAAFAA